MSDVRILLADDHLMVRDGLARIIASRPGFKVVAEAGDSRGILRMMQQHAPKIAVIAIAIEGVEFCQLVQEMRQRSPEINVLALAGPGDRCDLQELLRVGAKGYISKRASSDELVAAISAVAAGEFYIDPRAARTLVSVGIARHNAARLDLSAREKEVIRLLAQGFTNKEISAQLRLSAKTIETYKARSMKKLRLRSRVDLVRLATEHGWLGDG